MPDDRDLPEGVPPATEDIGLPTPPSPGRLPPPNIPAPPEPDGERHPDGDGAAGERGGDT